jgi:hypothetical protein
MVCDLEVDILTVRDLEVDILKVHYLEVDILTVGDLSDDIFLQQPLEAENAGFKFSKSVLLE